MSFLTSLVSAFKGGGGSRVPVARGFISPWATAFDGGPLGRSPFDYAREVAEAYLANPVAQRSVRIVAEGVGSAPVACDDARLAKLLAKSCGSQPLLEVLAAQLALHGNAYVQLIKDGAGVPVELFPLRPERVQVVAGEDGWPAAYRYVLADRTLTIAPEDEHGWPNIIHLRGFHPTDDHYGAGCLAAAAPAVAVHNAASEWNRALLANAARPSGALAFGVPPMLLGLPGDNTYANYREANRALWRLTLLPLAGKILAGLHAGLGDWFAEAPQIDVDRVPALAEDREKLWAQVSGADFLSDAEKRAMLGLSPMEMSA